MGKSQTVSVGLRSAGALVEFRILGPVEVWANGRRVDAGHARQRSVLAVLLLDLGRVVPADHLIDRVWADNPPGTVRNSLYGYLTRLRAVLAAAGDPAVTLTRRPEGYLLDAAPEKLDLCRFRHQVGEAAMVAGDDARAGPLLRSALALWHGPALAGLSGLWLCGMRDTLELQRIAAVLDLGDIALRQGQHSALVSELAGEAVTYPADERMIGQLMLALYRSGRQAEALRWFDQTRRQLADEFGADPGPELHALHQRILRADPSLGAPGPATRLTVPAGETAPPADWGAGTAGAAGPAWPEPRELPADVSAFTGRAAELAELDGFLGSCAGTPAVAVISAVSGTAGVGKTALAVHWAHRVVGRFPDGQLYVNLRGYDPGQPMTVADALARLLRALGVAGQDIPADEEERAARYRSLLAGRRMLVVLDNAGTAEQVRPLLPGSPTCAAVVTSRDSLAGLVARDGAARLGLGLLPLEDAVGLLRALIGERADTEPGAAAVLAGQCSRLPLALRVAAEFAVARPDVPLSSLVSELADQQGRLDLLAAGADPRTAVRAVFSWSYRHLGSDTARTFRLLGLHPGADLDTYATAALTGATLRQAGRALDLLVCAHLIQPAGQGRYGTHDLLRAYARDLTMAHDGEEERRAALTRLFDHYLYTAATAMDAVFPAERAQRPRIPAPDSPSPPVTDLPTARAWLDTELASLAAIATYTASNGWPSYTTRLAATLYRYLEAGDHYPEAMIIHSCAHNAGCRTGDAAAQATALTYLGLIDMRQGRYQRAADYHERALTLYRETGDRTGEARVLGNLGIVDYLLARYQQATGHHRQALDLYRETGNRTGEALTLNNLGLVDVRQGRYQQAIDYHEQALALFRAAGNRAAQAYALDNLGVVYLRQGRYQQAADHSGQALAIYRETGNKSGEAYVFINLGNIDLRQGQFTEAAAHHRHALAIVRVIGDLAAEAQALNSLGEVSLASAQPSDASAHFTSALRLASQIGDKYQQACAHSGLAETYHAAGDPKEARHHWQRALTLYTELGTPEADQVRAQLSAHANQEHQLGRH